MNPTYTWEFPAFEVVYHDGAMANIVQVVHWKRIAEDGEYRAEAYGTAQLPAPTGDDFTPYENITKQQVTKWVEDSLGTSAMQALNNGLIGQINDQKNPKSGPIAPPWSN
jgi:hypothetical protein